MKPSKYSDFAHTGPGTLAGRFIRHFWQPVYVGADLKVGRPVRIQILNEYFTLYRGESGTPYVLEDRCPHRQTSLSLGWVEGDCIRCFYHGWKFDGHGQCVEQPAEKAGFAAKVKARAYPTRGISRPDLRLSRRGRSAAAAALPRARRCRRRARRQSPSGAVQLLPARRERSRRDACAFRPSRLDRQLRPR